MDDYFDLGAFHMPITTTSRQAQTWFDRGLAWCYGFNHEEAIHCFRQALEHDPDCAMAHWGVAFASGPNYNKLWVDFGDAEREECLAVAREESRKALECADGAGDVEKGLAAALVARFPDDPEDDWPSWDDAYAAAMRQVHRLNPDHPDVCTLFADALMNRTPWKLWDLETGEPPAGSDTLEAIDVLETALSAIDGAWRHPGILHMHIHVMEMSPHPERALKTSDALHGLVPDSGHLHHMPTHIDVLCGDYQTVVERNHRAIIANRVFVERRGVFNFYSGYRAHDYHFKAYGAMFLGQFRPAIEAAQEMVSTLPAELLASGDPPLADWLEGYVPVRQHVLIRFGRWHDILDDSLPDDPDLYCVTTATMHYARGVAFSATGRVDEAEIEQQRFLEARDRVPDTRKLFHNSCLSILQVAGEMLSGELEYRKGNVDAAFDRLRQSVLLDDTLEYDEPWAWMQPTRHALGALLLEQGQVDEAEAIYRADLGFDDSLRRPCQHPDNVWSLHGLHECLSRRGETIELRHVRRRLDRAMARADVDIRASCYCRQSDP